MEEESRKWGLNLGPGPLISELGSVDFAICATLANKLVLYVNITLLLRSYHGNIMIRPLSGVTFASSESAFRFNVQLVLPWAQNQRKMVKIIIIWYS